MVKEIKLERVTSTGHRLDLPYQSECQNPHGHNYKWIVEIAGEVNDHGMVVDFGRVKEVVDEFDHADANEVMDVNPTAENMAQYVVDGLKGILDLRRIQTIRVTVYETEKATATASYFAGLGQNVPDSSEIDAQMNLSTEWIAQ